VFDGVNDYIGSLIPLSGGKEKTFGYWFNVNNYKQNKDGSVDLYFGPSLPKGAPESNFIKVVDGRNFLVAVRLFGTGIEFFDQTWKPDDVVKID
jgi:hypothetical protein